MTSTNVKQWKKEQYEVYASSFVDGDAILADGKWNKAYEENGDVLSNLLHKEMHFPLSINEAKQGKVEGSCSVFNAECTDTPCEIVTLDEYIPQNNDKIVWLGDGMFKFFTGKEYATVFSAETFTVRNGKVGLKSASPSFDVPYNHNEDILVEVSELPEKQLWGYIPRWDNVKELDNHSAVNECTDNCEIKSADSVIEAVEVLNDWYGKETTHQRLIEDLANMVSTVVLEGDYQLAQIGLSLIRQLEEEVK